MAPNKISAISTFTKISKAVGTIGTFEQNELPWIKATRADVTRLKVFYNRTWTTGSQLLPRTSVDLFNRQRLLRKRWKPTSYIGNRASLREKTRNEHKTDSTDRYNLYPPTRNNFFRTNLGQDSLSWGAQTATVTTLAKSLRSAMRRPSTGFLRKKWLLSEFEDAKLGSGERSAWTN